MNTLTVRLPLKPLAAAAAVVLCAACPADAATDFLISLTGAQEVGPVATSAMGFGTATLNDLGSGQFTLSYSITFSSDLNWGTGLGVTASNGGAITVTAFHVHNQARGVNTAALFTESTGRATT